MVYTKEGLNKISLEGDFHDREVLATLMHSPFTFCEDEEEDGLHKEYAIPPARELLEYEPPRIPIESMRRRLSRPQKKGLMPDFREVHLPYQGKSTYAYLEPRPKREQVGFAGFDLRCGNFISWSDRVRSFDGRLTDEIKIGMECGGRDNYRFLNHGEEFVLEYDPHGNRVYYIISHEGVLLSPNLEMIIDSKSTSARVGISSQFGGFTIDGKVISIVQPYAFDIKIRGGQSMLSQAFVRYEGSPYMQNSEIRESGEINITGDEMTLDNSLVPKGLQMKLGKGHAYFAKKCKEPIDIDGRNIDWRKYFERCEFDDRLDVDTMNLVLLRCAGVLETGATCGFISVEDSVGTGRGAWCNLAFGVQPFFSGEITAEYYRFSNGQVRVGDNAGVVVFDRLDGGHERPKNYGGSYQGQKAPMLPKMFI